MKTQHYGYIEMNKKTKPKLPKKDAAPKKNKPKVRYARKSGVTDQSKNKGA